MKKSCKNVIMIALTLLLCNYNIFKNDFINWSNTFFFSAILLTISTEVLMLNMNREIVKRNIDITDTLYYVLNIIYGQLFFGILFMWFNLMANHLTSIPYGIIVLLFCYKIITPDYEYEYEYELEEVIIEF